MPNAEEVIIGPRAISEALGAKAPIEKLLVGNYVNLKQNHGVAEIVRIAQSQNIKVEKTDKSVLEERSNHANHQGCLAIARPFKYNKIEDVLATTKEKVKSLIVILDHIEDAGNLGALARSALAFGVSALIIPNSRAAQVTATTYKTSAGAVFNLPIVRVSNINACIEQLKQNEYWVASASEHGSQNIWDTNLKGKIALVLGNEHKGVSKLVLENSDFIVKLPISNIESLNVAQAGTACMYEWVRQNA